MNSPEDRDRIQQDLNMLGKWVVVSNMQFNNNKFQVLQLANKNEGHAY